jgi:hypothetical protein
MAAIIQVSRLTSPNRRARVRQKVHVPAYATFSDSQSEMLDLYEVLDISENGVALHCPSPIQVNQNVELCLDLAEADMQISGTARVVWLDGTGRVGFGLPALADSAKRQLSEWLFLNALAAAANAELPVARSENSITDYSIDDWKNPVPRPNYTRPNYTDILSAVSAVQKEAELLGPDLEAVLALVASRSQSLLRASGAAVAMEEQNDKTSGQQESDKGDARTMICRASSGPCAPPVGVTLYVDSGFSGECVRRGKLLRCDDTETDERVDRQSCRALGIRSLIAVPVREREKIVGLLEVFSEQPDVFSENDCAVLQRLAETIQAAIMRARSEDDLPAPPTPSSKSFSPSGSVLFASMPERDMDTGEEKSRSDDQDKVGGIRLPRAYLYLLFAAAATIFLVLGFLAEPWIQEKLRARGQGEQHSVLASSKPPGNASAELQALADRGDPVSENALGLIYAAGDEKQGIKRDETEAARWFAKAAEHGSVPAQSKLGSLYWGGRGVKQDDTQAYFWTVLARASGDDASQALAPFIATRLSRSQRAEIEQRAEQWLERYESASKPVAGR